LVGVNSYFMNEIGWHNLQNLHTHFDLDMEFYHPNLKQYRELVVYSLAKFDDINIPYQFIFHSFVKKVAQQKKVRYIVYGENQPTEQTGNFSNFDYPEKSLWFHLVFDFRSLDLDKFLGTGASFNLSNLPMYQYPKQNSLYPKGVFLSHYIRWDSIKNNNTMANFGFWPEKQIRTYDRYHRAGYSHYYEIHDFLRFKKHGYIKVRDHLNRDIRMGHINREIAQKLYEGFLNIPYNFSEFFNWIGIEESGSEWLLRHKLSNQNSKEFTLFEYEKFLKNFDLKGLIPQNHYLPFFKGVHIGDDYSG